MPSMYIEKNEGSIVDDSEETLIDLMLIFTSRRQRLVSRIDQFVIGGDCGGSVA